MYNCTYTRPRCQVSVYRTIGPLLSNAGAKSTSTELLFITYSTKLIVIAVEIHIHV